MKTNIYIDGFNLYYGCLRGTPHKWLDIFKLFNDHVLPSSQPEHGANDVFVKYFTAQIIDKAAKSSTSVQDQIAYHRALSFTYPLHRLEIIKGYYSLITTSAYQLDPINPKRFPKDCQRVNIWKLEEKQTDVNIAVESLFDVMTDPELQQVVFVTNDTDIAPVMAKIKSLQKVQIGLVIPTNQQARSTNQDLAKHADWVRDCIQDYELAAAQLPRIIKGGRTPAVKPVSWFGQPQILEQIIQLLLPVCEYKPSKCWRWLEHDLPQRADLPPLPSAPIHHLASKEDAMLVLAYAKRFVEFMENKQ
ncbi:NYN domain-containing protein [Rheinheimera riviphila]|uniref:NYN domain-containing protein n=1 Tax=Rheinheimera riviphila TaxID=1834037 RepID=A0A437QBP8_9GAMM|nr:NYN domain-containing protein [Rheinheimera riviphila]RVU31978.1 NYN domain-containing protein [Rheinheimera riviphila]